MRSMVVVVLLAVAATACSRLHAKAVPETLALDVPAPPPHEVEATETEAPPPVPLPEEPAHNAPIRPRQTPPPTNQPRTDTPRPEQPKPETPAAPAAEQPKPEEPARPAPLQTMPTTAEGDMERQIRASVQRANTDLNRIDYRMLNADARNQYDTAKRFIRQADDAVRAKNLLFAKNLADKAATLAAQLASGR